jgi:hypothetical protein
MTVIIVSDEDFKNNFVLLENPLNKDNQYYINKKGHICNSFNIKLQGYTASKDGYHRATLKFGVVYIHKLVFIHYHSCIPSDYEIDHINRNKDDNSIENLRCVTVSENRKNRQFKIRTRKNIKSHI